VARLLPGQHHTAALQEPYRRQWGRQRQLQRPPAACRSTLHSASRGAGRAHRRGALRRSGTAGGRRVCNSCGGAPSSSSPAEGEGGKQGREGLTGLQWEPLALPLCCPDASVHAGRCAGVHGGWGAQWLASQFVFVHQGGQFGKIIDITDACAQCPCTSRCNQMRMNCANTLGDSLGVMRGCHMHAGCPICRRALPQAALSCAMVSESGCRVQEGHGGGKQGGAAPSLPCTPSTRRLAWPATRLKRCTGVAVIATGGVGGKAREIGKCDCECTSG
jgi:hypothetical protein